MTKNGSRELLLAERLRELLNAVAAGSAIRLARLLNDVPMNQTTSRTDEIGRRIETDRRLIQRWLAADALMERPSRKRLLDAANGILVQEGRSPFPGDFFEIESDHLAEINQKLSRILELLVKQEKRAPRWEKALKQQLGEVAAEQSGPVSPRRRADAR